MTLHALLGAYPWRGSSLILCLGLMLGCGSDAALPVPSELPSAGEPASAADAQGRRDADRAEGQDLGPRGDEDAAQAPLDVTQRPSEDSASLDIDAPRDEADEELQPSDIEGDEGSGADLGEVISADVGPDLGPHDSEVAGGDAPVSPGAAPPSDTDASDDEPANPTLKVNHLQAIGTHNSYHVAPIIAAVVPPWDYTHLPLDQQAADQGVRQFELDVYHNGGEGTFDVLHVPFLDPDTNCASFQECLTHLKSFSDAHPDHHPMLVLVEPKSEVVTLDAAGFMADLEARALEVWPAERLVLPDDVQGTHNNLRDAIAAQGWPTMESMRGRLILVLHASGALREVYTEELTTTEGRIFFPDCYGDLSVPVAAVHSMNSPVNDLVKIQGVVSAGHLVRTRADSEGEETDPVDYTRFEAALESGAHFISTDYPFPGDDETYGVVIPEGTPSGCNPITALADCSPEAVESL